MPSFLRRTLTRLAPLVALALAAPPVAAAPRVTTFALENGMQGVVIEDHRAPVVTHMVWYRVGAADEPRGKSGIAHFLEHLMFKGTDKIPDAAFSRIIAANGGQDNAFTSYDYTAYFQRLAADRLELAMEMEADRMRNLRLSEEQVRTERDVVLEERSQRTDSDPFALFSEQRGAALYLNHPYGIPVIGWRHEVAALTRDDALAFYRTWYAPDNAILVVAGDVDPAEVERLARKHYGPLAPSHPPERARPQEPRQLAARRIEYADARVRQPYVVRSYLAPARRQDQARAAALAVLAEILGGGPAARLQQALTIGSDLAVGVGAWYEADRRDPGAFTLYAAPRPGRSLAEVEAAMDRVIADFLASDGPSDEELARVKAGARADLIYAQDSQQAMAQMYGAGLAAGLTLEQIRSWPDAIAAVDAEDVMEAARALFDKRRSVTGWLTGAEDAAAPVGAAPPEDAPAARPLVESGAAQ
ncbi:M16 family metallopeptidase [Oceanicella actignis]|uniref:Zinc protease n=1 Tax=Oceanicella actignis TaxID=1189325 RepID=A0A1M7TJ95_9RHOB|nr:pitrilysin family protein [Oceanicella actignis]SET66337.1 zinc protease [Oceanicella actignis]SHN70832.1 zinc protease [Oceanicella actignis]